MIRRQITIPAGPEQVWKALTDPDRTEAWFGGRIDWGPAEGGPLRFVSDGGQVREGIVELVRPARHLRFRWWPAGELGDSESGGGDTEVSYTLEEDGGGTRLTVQERPAAPVDAFEAFNPSGISDMSDTWTDLDGMHLQMHAARTHAGRTHAGQMHPGEVPCHAGDLCVVG